jgi:copper chaperone
MVSFQVEDVTCGQCASRITRAVASVDPDATVEVSIPQKLVRVVTSAGEDDIGSAIARAGYTPRRVEAGAARFREQAAGGCCCGSRSRTATAAAAGPADATPKASCCG